MLVNLDFGNTAQTLIRISNVYGILGFFCRKAGDSAGLLGTPGVECFPIEIASGVSKQSPGLFSCPGGLYV